MLQFLFHIKPNVLVHGTVVTSDQITQKRSKSLDKGFSHFPRVGKHQRRVVSTDKIGDGFNVVLKDLHHRQIAEFWMGDENVKIQFPRSRNFGDGYLCGLTPRFPVVAADQILRYFFEGLHGG